MAWWRAEEWWSSGITAFTRCRCRIPARPRSGHPQKAVRTAVSQVDSMKGRLRGGTVTPHSRSCSHAGGEGAARFALQVDTEAMGVLGMLEKKPGTGEGLLTGGAGVTAGLIFI